MKDNYVKDLENQIRCYEDEVLELEDTIKYFIKKYGVDSSDFYMLRGIYGDRFVK